MSSKIHADYDKVVTKKDLTKVFLREITYEHTWNYERMGNVGFCFSMYPVLKKLYPDKKDLAAAMKRHLTLYQTSHYLATFQMGITAAMEEENAQVKQSPEEIRQKELKEVIEFSVLGHDQGNRNRNRMFTCLAGEHSRTYSLPFDL